MYIIFLLKETHLSVVQLDQVYCFWSMDIPFLSNLDQVWIKSETFVHHSGLLQGTIQSLDRKRSEKYHVRKRTIVHKRFIKNARNISNFMF